MSQRIHLGAIVLREDRILVFQEAGAEHWELPGGALAPEHDDVDVGMQVLLSERGIATADLQDAFIETLYIPRDDGHIVYNLYSAGTWQGEPSAPPNGNESWVTPADISGLAMDERVRHVLLVAFGLREPVDDAVEIMKSMQRTLGGDAPDVAPTGPKGRTEAGLDILQALAGGDPATAESRLRERYGELGDDAVDFALGEVWSDDTIDRRTGSLMVVSMLAALGHSEQLRPHFAGALNQGVTPAELVQAMRTVAVYAGFPAAMTAHDVLNEVFEARGIKLPGAGS